MPTFPITPFTASETISIFYIAFDGTERRTQIQNPEITVTPSLINTLADALGELSTMGLYQWSGAGEKHRIPKVNATAFDELYGSGVTLYINFVSASDPDDTRTIRVPAPDAAFITGTRLNDPSTSPPIQNAVDAALAILNVDVGDPPAASNDYVFDYGYTDADESQKRSIPGAGEPGTGSEEEGPGSNPGA
jgi:hypothetical protein